MLIAFITYNTDNNFKNINKTLITYIHQCVGVSVQTFQNVKFILYATTQEHHCCVQT